MQGIKVAVAYLKLACVGVYTLGMLAWLFIRLPFVSRARGERLGHNTIQRWARWTTTHVLGIRPHVHGELPRTGTLLVANHITYVDPPLLLAATPCTMLAKYEVSRYPVIGFGARAVGILFVRRDTEGSRVAAQKAIADGLLAGRVVCLFPEGTTSPEGTVLEFRAGSFRAAAAAGAPVVPIAITYRRRNLSWLGKEQLVPHFIRNHAMGRIDVDVWVGPTLQHDDPEWLRETSEHWIRRKVTEVFSEAPVPIPS